VADLDVEWEHRRLCTDGACIGVIGDDGRCKVCGALAPETGGPFRATPLEAEMMVNVVDDGADAAQASAQASGTSAELDDERELCPDDACIGLIGADGRCKECGKPRA